MTKPWRVHVFGVRHLSPMGAWHLRRYLDQQQPKLVLVEGLADATELVSHITRAGTRPPIAILAYTDALPVRTLIYPLARYSPEYQGLKWAREHKAGVDFIDLPSDIFLALQDIEVERAAQRREKPAEPTGPEGGETSLPSPMRDDELPAGGERDSPEQTRSIYEQYAERAGEADYETYWERTFEHNLSDDAYRLAAYEFGAGLRELERPAPVWRAENLVREAYMRRRVEEAIAAGTPAERIVAVVGAFHAPVLSGDFPAMTDDELASLRRRSSKLTLMPYSYFKLSTQSGYGAGNHAPAYFELLWESLERGDLAELPARYLSLVVRQLREAGTHRSTAEVIEGVRLAKALSALKDGQAPTLSDLRAAAVALLGHGELMTIKDAIVRVEVGTAIGELPSGVSRTSIQADFDRELSRLKLEKYKTTVRQELSLDLRENRQAKTAASAFLDLDRSAFFHRLRVLGIGFAVPVRSSQQAATWSERWLLQWSPESEIQLIEAVLLGETVELATGYAFSTRLADCISIAAAAELTRDACECGLMRAMDSARKRLQELSAGTSDLKAIAHAAHVISQTVRYGDVRKFDPEPLLPLVEELFVQGALALHDAASCDNETALQMLVAIDEMDQVALEHSDRVDEKLWLEQLQRLSDADDRNPLLSGYSCALLLERELIPNEALAREVSRRLSPGVPADLGTGWFEGLAKRNRYALLARQMLWAQLADYVAALDEKDFVRSLVFLRRAFGCFSPREKRQIAENLAEHWGVSADAASEAIEAELSEDEAQKLAELNEFDFGDL